MLVELAIRNFAIIDCVRLIFRPGLNVLTGETGAGKSILIDALGAVLGERVSVDVVRTGARAASIDATFDFTELPNRDDVAALLSELHLEDEEGLLILGREIQASGRSSARLNGRPTTAAILAQIGSLLVDVHGQSEHLSLLRPGVQLTLLDRYAQTVDLRETFARKLAELRNVRHMLQEIASSSRERIQRIDLLRYQIDEIVQAGLQPGEEDDLIGERSRLANADRLIRDAASAYALLASDDDVDRQGAAIPALRQAAQIVANLETLDPSTHVLLERVSEMLFLLEDVAGEMRAYRDAIEADPERLEHVEERLAELRQLQRKYGSTVADVLEYARLAQEELGRLTGADMNVAAVAAREVELAAEVGRLAGALSTQRAAKAIALAAEVKRAIARLKMGAAEFSVVIDRRVDPSGVPVPQPGETGGAALFAADASGIDRVEFHIAPNAGEALKPLGRIASGGETARLMLALKSVLSHVDRTPTLVFDEVDVGVGGRSGHVVGETLWGLATGHQVIVITHLPQIAAFGETHFRIAKAEADGRVVSTITELGGEERVQELAAMLDGNPVTASSIQNAAEMIERVRTFKGQLKRSTP